MLKKCFYIILISIFFSSYNSCSATENFFENWISRKRIIQVGLIGVCILGYWFCFTNQDEPIFSEQDLLDRMTELYSAGSGEVGDKKTLRDQILTLDAKMFLALGFTVDTGLIVVPSWMKQHKLDSVLAEIKSHQKNFFQNNSVDVKDSKFPADYVKSVYSDYIKLVWLVDRGLKDRVKKLSLKPLVDLVTDGDFIKTTKFFDDLYSAITKLDHQPSNSLNPAVASVYEYLSNDFVGLYKNNLTNFLNSSSQDETQKILVKAKDYWKVQSANQVNSDYAIYKEIIQAINSAWSPSN